MSDWLLFIGAIVILLGIFAVFALSDGTIYTSTTTERHVWRSGVGSKENPPR